jgi:predicted methyltransferase
MNVEFIQKDKQRLAIFQGLAKAELSVEQLVDRNHIKLETVKDVLNSMEQEGIVALKGEVYFLTDEGRKLAHELQKSVNIDAGPIKRTKRQNAKGDMFAGHDYKRR